VALSNTQRDPGRFASFRSGDLEATDEQLRELAVASAQSGIETLAAAERAANESLTSLEKRLGAQNRELTQPLNSLAQIAMRRGRPKEAERYLLRALSLWKDKPYDLGSLGTLKNYADILRALGRAEEAGAIERHIAEIQVKTAAPPN